MRISDWSSDVCSSDLSDAERMTIELLGPVVNYSRKVFIPLTTLCRYVWHYCTFAKAPRQHRSPYLSRDAVLAIARPGSEAGCRESYHPACDPPAAGHGGHRSASATLCFEHNLR